MKAVDFLEAVAILTKNHSNEIVVNKSTGHGSTTGNEANPTLHITNCTASAINNLKEAGFSLSMDNGFMSVSKF